MDPYGMWLTWVGKPIIAWFRFNSKASDLRQCDHISWNSKKIKSSNSSYYLKVTSFIIAQKVPNIWTTFARTFKNCPIWSRWHQSTLASEYKKLDTFFTWPPIFSLENVTIRRPIISWLNIILKGRSSAD